MKTLINKQNSQVKITAPEIETLYDKYHRVKYYYIKDLRMGLLREHWALVEEEPTCRSCGFYENNCPFIRGKFVPYPSRVCKDYIHSAMKEQKPEVDLEEETKKWWKKHLGLKPENQLWMDAYQSVEFARHFYELGRKGGGE